MVATVIKEYAFIQGKNALLILSVFNTIISRRDLRIEKQ